MNPLLSHAHVVIMAGGSGTRFWPASRRRKPKQLLPLAPSGEVLLTATVRRAVEMVGKHHVWVVSGAVLKQATRNAAPGLPEAQFLDEPIGRNTAPCVAWAAAEVAARDPEATLLVLPADHHIGDEAAYRTVLEQAVRAAATGSLVTVGISPTRPETGFGYIELAEEIKPAVHRAKRFVEKPDLETARAYLESGNFLWNSGMFFFRADTILRSIREHLPGIGAALGVFGRHDLSVARERWVEQFSNLPNISIDHGVMEKAANIEVVRGDFGWSDLGSWLSTWELSAKDAAENVLGSNVVALESRGCLVQSSQEKLVALLGVEDLVVVETEDALLITTKGRSQQVKEIVKVLVESGRGSFT